MHSIRLSFRHFREDLKLPDLVLRGLRFIPAAVLSALIVPALPRPQNTLNLSWHNPYLLAGILAIIISVISRSVLLTLIGGMLALWLVKMLTT